MPANPTIRKTLIRIAQRKQKAGSGSSRHFLRKRTCHMQWPQLGSVLGEINFAVVGAVATRLYAPERATKDMGVVVLVGDFELASHKLAQAGWENVAELSIGGNSWRSPRGEEVDLLEGHEIWWAQAINEAQTNRDAQGLPILPLPYLVLMKFQSGRTVDIGDIARMLGQADEQNLGKMRQLFQRFKEAGLDHLESLIELGRLEME